jgi:adenylate cyclase
MHEIDKQKLLALLLAHFDIRHKTAGPGQTQDGEVRLAMAEIIDSAWVKSQEVDTRRVTILLSDLRGFTAMSEKYSALEMVQTLNRYFKRMSEIIIRHGGTIDKFMGDAIMALFGAPVARDDDIEAALACAIEMQMAMNDINQDNLAHGMAPLYMGIGINTGNVVAGHLGSALHSEYTVIGDQVNLASRVEAHSLRGQILLSENTYLLAQHFIQTGEVNEVRVKGKKGVVRLYELLSTQRPTPLIAPQREIRNSPRVEADMALTFQLLDGKSVLPQEHMARVVDISYGGMYFVSPLPLSPFDDIKIKLHLSMLDAQAAEVYAKVLRVAPCHGAWECRIELTAIDPSTALALKEFVDGMVELNRNR